MSRKDRELQPDGERRTDVWTKTMLNTEVDPETDIAYIRVSNRPVAITRAFGDLINVDFDSEGDIIGIEVVDMNIRKARDKETSYLNSDPK